MHSMLAHVCVLLYLKSLSNLLHWDMSGYREMGDTCPTHLQTEAQQPHYPDHGAAAGSLTVALNSSSIAHHWSEAHDILSLSLHFLMTKCGQHRPHGTVMKTSFYNRQATNSESPPPAKAHSPTAGTQDDRMSAMARNRHSHSEGSPVLCKPPVFLAQFQTLPHIKPGRTF